MNLLFLFLHVWHGIFLIFVWLLRLSFTLYWIECICIVNIWAHAHWQRRYLCFILSNIHSIWLHEKSRTTRNREAFVSKCDVGLKREKKTCFFFSFYAKQNKTYAFHILLQNKFESVSIAIYTQFHSIKMRSVYLSQYFQFQFHVCVKYTPDIPMYGLR